MTRKTKPGKKIAADQSVTEKSKRGKKLIRLDDLIPKKDVHGGRQVLFGVRDSNSGSDDPTGR